MKIRFTLVCPDTFKQVRAKVELLQSAVKVGDMEKVDTVTESLLASTRECPSVDLSEEDWRAFLDGIRKSNPEFQSNYLLPAEICAKIFPTVTTEDYVLELPIDEELEKEYTNV